MYSLLELDAVDLIKVSSKSEECFTNAKTAFKTNYHRTLITVCGPFNEDVTEKIKQTRNNIYIQSLDVVQYVLMMFCDNIEYLRIFFNNISKADGRQIISQISDKCYKSLTSLHLGNSMAYSLNGFQNIFANVYDLAVSSQIAEMMADEPVHYHFNVLFPNVYLLHLDNVSDLHWQWFDGNFVKLQKLYVKLPKPKEINEAHTPYVIKFIKQNFLIRHLSGIVIENK